MWNRPGHTFSCWYSTLDSERKTILSLFMPSLGGKKVNLKGTGIQLGCPWRWESSPATLDERKRGRVACVLPKMLICGEITNVLENCGKGGGSCQSFGEARRLPMCPKTAIAGGGVRGVWRKHGDYQRARKLCVGTCWSLGEFSSVLKSGGWALDWYFTVNAAIKGVNWQETGCTS